MTERSGVNNQGVAKSTQPSRSRGLAALLVAAICVVLGAGVVTYFMLGFTNAPVAGGNSRSPEGPDTTIESTPGQQISGQPSEPGGSHNSPSPDESEDEEEDEEETTPSEGQGDLGASLPSTVDGYTLDWSGNLGLYSKGPFDQVTVMQYGGLTKLSNASLLFKDGTKYEIDGGRGVCGELAGTQCYLETKRFGVISVTGMSDAAPRTVPAIAKAILGKIS